MKIAVIGSGISSLSSAYYLKKQNHHLTVFESNSYFGGHTNTVRINVEDQWVNVDTGFLVFNEKTYPHLIKLFEELKIESCQTDMSLSVQVLSKHLEWSGDHPFIQKKNLFSPSFWKMLLDINKFNKMSAGFIEDCLINPKITLGDLMTREKFSQEFIEWYLIPMGAAIWSTPSNKMLNFPAFTFLKFCQNHQLLQITNHLKWRTVIGGAKNYVEKIINLIDEKYLQTPVEKIERINGKVKIHFLGQEKIFDMVIVGTHPPQTLQMLNPKSNLEQNILSQFKYQQNLAILHCDESVLPKNKKSWSSWNYTTAAQSLSDDASPVEVSYLINKLQPLPVATPLIVTLNPHQKIDENKIFQKINYHHPLFDENSIKAQKDISQIQGQGNVYYVGAWQRYGFHEDGIWSAVQAVELIKSKYE